MLPARSVYSLHIHKHRALCRCQLTVIGAPQCLELLFNSMVMHENVHLVSAVLQSLQPVQMCGVGHLHSAYIPSSRHGSPTFPHTQSNLLACTYPTQFFACTGINIWESLQYPFRHALFLLPGCQGTPRYLAVFLNVLYDGMHGGKTVFVCIITLLLLACRVV